jgi:hypothetical protein
LAFTKTTTTGQTIIESMRLKKLHIWLPGFVVTSTTAVVNPYAALSVRDFVLPGMGKEQEYQLTVNSSKGLYFCYKFKGFSSSWFNAASISSLPTAEQFFVLSPVGTIPVVQLDFVCQLIQTASGPSAAPGLGFQLTLDTTTAGALLYMPLNSMTDFDTEGAGTYLPIGCQTQTVNMPSPGPRQLLGSRLPIVAPPVSSSSSSGACVANCGCTRM